MMDEEIVFEYDEFADFSAVEGRNFNFSLDGIFNNSLITVGAFIVLGIIFFELALYALDVYYNKTYGFGGSSYSSYGGKDDYYARYKSDLIKNYDMFVINNFRIDQELPLLYQPLPKYRDPFVDTYRSLGVGWSFDKILEWIELAKETYDTGSEILSDLECQKHAVCEVYQDGSVLGEFGARARHSLDFVDQMATLKLPDFIGNTLDEFQDAKQSAFDVVSCHDLYPSCQKSLTQIKRRFFNR